MLHRITLLSLCLLTVAIYAADETGKHTLLWLDLEMTGLSAENDLILQSAAIVTDDNLEIVAECPEREVHYDALPKMDPYVFAMHTTSGLLDKVEQSKLTLPEVEDELISFVKAHCKSKNTQLCGNSIWKDRQFLEKHMPRFIALFHHQMIDVSSIGGVAWRWYPEECKKFQKQKTHTSRKDILQSIEELKHFREHIFKNKQN